MVCSERPTEPSPNVEPSSLRRGLTHISKVLSNVHYSKQGFARISCANQSPAYTAANPNAPPDRSLLRTLVLVAHHRAARSYPARKDPLRGPPSSNRRKVTPGW